MALLAGAAVLLLWSTARTPLAGLSTAVGAPLDLTIDVITVALDLLIFLTAYSAMLSRRKGAVIWLGVCFLGVAMLDMLHLLQANDAKASGETVTNPLAAFYWLTARLLMTLALLVYVKLPMVTHVPRARRRMAVALILVVVAFLAHILPWLFQVLPNQWLLKGMGILTMGLTSATIAMMLPRYRKYHSAVEFTPLMAAALSLAAIMLLLSDEATALLGHAYVIAGNIVLLRATHDEALARPLRLIKSQWRHETMALNVAPDAILWVDDSGTILSANPATERITGYMPVELIGQNVNVLLPEQVRARHATSMRDYFSKPKLRPMGSLDLRLLRRDGSELPVDIALNHWEDDGHPVAVAFIRDLSERKNMEDALRHQATHDELTNLPNRWLFRLQLRQAIARAMRGQKKVAVMLLDLDNFKNINDRFGHAVGDSLLFQVGQRMRTALRENDLLARLGGDEFAILLADLDTTEAALPVAKKLLNALLPAIQLPDRQIDTSGSLGLAFYPDDASDDETLLRYADLAMYRAKRSGRNNYASYAQDMDHRLQEDMLLQERLKSAQSNGDLQLHYQPIISVNSGLIVGAEALLRWNDPVLGQVAPTRFIHAAETSGQIHTISEWVLAQACQQIAEWCAQGTPLKVAVNFSTTQFRQPDLIARVKNVLERTGAPAEWLDIEITETLAMSHPEEAGQKIHALAELGCSVALDDFGTGYSSLAYLKSLPVSKLKIDKHFLEGIPNDSNAATLTRTIISLAHNLGIQVVAEGVETTEQLDFLRAHGCHVYQGWLDSRAMTANALGIQLALTSRYLPLRAISH